jgi:hypothetical protein
MSDPFAMAPLYPTETGLPMTVWVQPRSRTRSDVRIVVNGVSGPRPTIAKPKIVAVRPSPRVISGWLPLIHQRMVFAWARLNETALVDYWAGVIGTVDFARRLRTLPVIEARDAPGERTATGCERLSSVTLKSRRSRRQDGRPQGPDCGCGPPMAQRLTRG